MPVVHGVRATTSSPRYVTRWFRKIPNEDVLDMEGIIKNNPRYVTHIRLPNGDGTTDLQVIYRKG